MTSIVIFEIDNPTDLHQIAKFTRWLDTLRALGKMEGTAIQAVGCYEGSINPAWIMRQDDFEEHVLNSDYVIDQESFLYVDDVGKKEGRHRTARLVELPGIIETPLGKLYDVPGPYALRECKGWTYRPDLDVYWTTA